MAFELIWTEQSANDLANIADYIAQDSVRYAKLTVRKIRLAARHLKNHPEIGRIVPEAGRQDIRELIIGNYRLIYKSI